MKHPWGIAKVLVVAALVAGVFSFALQPAEAAAPTTVPNTISFQGKIVNFSDGTNVADGTYSVTFKLYSASSGGSSIWGETQASVQVTGGVFQVNLGSTCSFFTTQTCSGFSNTAIDFSTGPSLYLTMKFAADSQETSPRIPLQSVPFAFNAETANQLGGRTASQFVQVSPASAQSGFINMTFTQATTGVAATFAATNSNSSATPATINGISINLAGATNSNANANTINALNFANVTPITNNTFNGLVFGTGYNNLIQSANFNVAASGFVSLGTATQGYQLDMRSSTASQLHLTSGSADGDAYLFGGFGGVFVSANAAWNGGQWVAKATTASLLQEQNGSLIFKSDASLTAGNTFTPTTRFTVDGSGNLSVTGTITGTTVNGTTGINTGASAGTQRIDSSGNLVNIGTIGAAGGKYALNSSGDQTAAFTLLDGSSTTNGTSGLGSSTSLTLTSAANFDVGNYVQVNASNCGGTGINPCYAKITAKATNTLTITPALTWTSGQNVFEYHIPEIGGTDTAQTLANRYGRGYFIGGVATGNGTTYYSEEGISTSLSSFDLLNTGVTTLNIGGAATAINIGTSGTTTTVAGTLSTSGGGNINAGSGQLQGNSLSINSGAFAVDSSGAITAGSASTSLLTSGTLGTSRGGTGLASYTANSVLYASNSSTIAQATASSGQILLGNASGVPTFTAVTGDVTIGSTGVTAIGSGKVTNAMLVNSVVNFANGTNTTVSSTTGTLGGSAIAVNLVASPSVTSLTASAGNGALLADGTFSASTTVPLVQLGGALVSGSSNGTYLGINQGSGGTADFLNFQINGGAYKLKVTSAGLVDATGGLAVGGTTVVTSGRILQNVTADTNILTSGTLGTARGGTGLASFTSNSVLYASNSSTITQATPSTTAQILLSNGSSVPTFTTVTGDVTISATGVTAIGATKVTNAMLANSSLTISNGTNITGGGSVSLGGTLTVGTITNPTFSGLVTASASGVNALAVTGAPVNTATLSLVRIGNAIASGDTTANGGTWIGLNAPGSGAGSVADFLNLQVNGVSKFKVNSAGTVTVNSSNVGITVNCSTNGNDYYVGNGVRVTGGIVTAGTCRQDASGLSDARLKDNITTYDGQTALDAVNQLQAVTFNFNETYHEVSGINEDPGLQYGFIAQDVMQVMPDLVKLQSNGYYKLDYNALHAILTAAVQQLDRKVDQIANGTSSGGDIITSHVSSNGALRIDSGTSGDVTIDSGSNSAVVNIGATSASTVKIGHTGSTTAVEGNVNFSFADNEGFTLSNKATNSAIQDSALRIDNANASQKVTTAVKITNSGGAGYDTIISSPNFTVTGDGSVMAGTISGKGSFALFDAASNQVASIDESGNANFDGNLTAAHLTATGGLSVGGDADFAGLSTFQKLATFFGKVIFRKDVRFDAHITVASDTAGYAQLKMGETTVHVTFTDPYETTPIVTANISNGQFALYSVNNVTPSGFDVSLATAAASDTTLSWTAFGVTSPQTATNPPANP